MPQLESILTVAFAGFALSATPGPSMLYVLSRTVGQSRAAGIASAIGLGLGGILLAVASAFGLALIFAKFDWLVVILRYVGSAYLIWLGVELIQNARQSAQTEFEVERVRGQSFSKIIWQGIVVELLNPKTVLFFALFLPPFVNAGTGDGGEISVQMQLLMLGVLVPLTAIPSDLAMAYLGGTMVQIINRQQAFREGLAWFSGLVLITIAVNLHLELF